MAYIKTNYINSNQITAGNLNKIENELFALDEDVETLKTEIEKISDSNNLGTSTVINGKDGVSVSGVSCTSEQVSTGTKLTFTFNLSDLSNIRADVIIPTITNNTTASN
jgi:hypothetical protein